MITSVGRTVRPAASILTPRWFSSVSTGGRGLSAYEKQALAPYIPAMDLNAAIVHEGVVPFYLPRKYRAIARGTRIFFRSGAYDPMQIEGLALLGHELVHVGQYRSGMTWLSYLWSVRLGYSKSAYECAAFAMQKRIVETLTRSGIPGQPPG